ncbi:hypothetical protein [Mycetocola saprophilus]|uniref:hypothetical protein n=1 Tax=Mycetocola saprophilus TaxID=76636 RepID=UPI0012DFAF71|nr:hypothetical protein [Mycetocola saprophilus]
MTRIKYAGLMGRLVMLMWSVIVLVVPVVAPVSNPVEQKITWIAAIVLSCIALLAAALIGVYVTQNSVIMIGLTRVSVFPLESLERFGTVHVSAAFLPDFLWAGLIPAVTVTGGGRTRAFATNVHFARHAPKIVARGRALITQRRAALGLDPIAGPGWNVALPEDPTIPTVAPR